MKTMAAGRFKNMCLRTLDEVEKSRTSVVITKRGRPVARLVPFVPQKTRTLVGSVLKATGNPFSTGDAWNADRS